ncbi:MAG: hypothetical protein MZV63_15760 [Marinilabiliales bacterium]|nr:hypothetical protein [Marinilabiliales bacterium]
MPRPMFITSLLEKSYFPKESFIDKVRIGTMLGFYVWQNQTKLNWRRMKDRLAELGIDLNHKGCSWRNEIAGCNGYDAYRYAGIERESNDPPIYGKPILHCKQNILTGNGSYQNGFMDYQYQNIQVFSNLQVLVSAI